MVRSRRAWIYVLSLAALVVPAGGIAYLGAVSYRDERGAVSAQNERQHQAALGVASRISRAIEDALDATERAVAAGGRPAAPLARYWFWIDRGQLRVPRAAPPAGELGGGLERSAGCAFGPLEDCVQELVTRQARIARLRAAERAEAAGSWGDARRQYTALAGFDDTGPSALLGLARVLARLGDGRSAGVLGELERRFGDRGLGEVPARVAVAALRAEGGPAGTGQAAPRAPLPHPPPTTLPPGAIGAVLGLADDVLADRYGLAPVIRIGVVAALRARLPAALSEDQARRLAALDERVAALRTEARAAAGLAPDVVEMARTAAAAWRGRAAGREPMRTLIYRRRGDGGVIGFAVDPPMLEAVAVAAAGETSELAGLASRARPYVLLPGTSPGPDLRTLHQVPLGAAAPHLGVAIVNPVSDPDPLDAVIRERSRRHVIYTSALAIALGLGLLAMIRGAVRARELAQLKSDFVSTVSHELKTPLTSIRMFAEMLEQGVARGDAGKLARYHRVIVQESQRLGLLIANLLDYAQIEKGTRRYTPTREAIGPLARHAVATFDSLRDPDGASASPLGIAVSDEAMRAEVEVDRDVVVGAVLNLLANAVKYGAGRPVEVEVGAAADAAWIAVRDHGPGIPPTEQARIFREFYRAPEAYRSGVEGTGLGLALVKRHVEALGGSVEVASKLGDGATFTIRLPRAAAEAAE
ncbi:MAG TPA: HAMP domain-containing sensor histidine kinase [Kofleriaceae bacterium]|nr:HAMP domain-containing sensor histidine kinase [Kofleriaceae bacterium]